MSISCIEPDLMSIVVYIFLFLRGYGQFFKHATRSLFNVIARQLNGLIAAKRKIYMYHENYLSDVKIVSMFLVFIVTIYD